MNLIILTGRLTRDPELKFGQSGKAYSKFSLAVTNPFKKDEADFINCVAFGKTAELIGEYLRKGSKAAVNGRLQMNRYEVNGEKRTSYDVLVENVEFLDSKGSSDTSFDNSPSYEGKSSGSAPIKEESFDDDEFPF